MSSWLLAQLYLHYIDGQDMNDILLRAKLIAEHLAAGQYDIIALQEAADYSAKVIMDNILLKAGYHSSERLGESNSHLNGWYLFNSGITLYSRHPFLSLEYHTFSRSASSQMFIPKGAIYAKINFEGKDVHLFNLHLQSIHSNTPSEHELLAQHQLDLKQLIDTKNIGSNEHVFIMGDFNMDASKCHEKRESEDFNAFKASINAIEATSRAKSSLLYSFDTVNNAMAKGKSPRGSLDNILCIRSPHCPYPGTMRTFRFPGGQTRLGELSDHHPVEAQLDLR